MCEIAGGRFIKQIKPEQQEIKQQKAAESSRRRIKQRKTDNIPPTKGILDPCRWNTGHVLSVICS